MTRLTGVIESVQVVRSGGNLAADVPAGATVLPMDAATDFDDDGGTLTVNGATYDYTAVDYDTDEVTLSTGLTVGAAQDDPVFTLDANGDPEIDDWLVMVDIDDGGDTIPAEVPSREQPYFPERSSVVTGMLVDIESFSGEKTRTSEEASSGWRVASRPFQETTPDTPLRLSSAGDELVAGLTPEGSFAAQDYDVTGYLRVGLARLLADGQPLNELLASFSRGIWGWGERTPSVTKIGNTGYGVLTMRLYLPEARRVSFHLQLGATLSADAARFNAVIRANYSATTMPAQATGASTNYATFKFTSDVAAGNSDTYVASYGRVLEAGYYSLRLELRTIAGAVTLDTSGATTLEVTDRGPANASENQAFKPTSPGTLASGGVDSGSSSAPQTRTETYLYHCTDSRAYLGSGALKVADGDLWVGDGEYFGEGNYKSALWFDDAKIRDDLADAAATKVEVFLYAFFRSGSTAGTVPIGYHGDATPRGTWVEVMDKQPDEVRAGSWRAPSGRWVTLPLSLAAELADGSVKGLVVGPGPTTSTEFLFGLYGPDREANTPTLRITVER